MNEETKVAVQAELETLGSVDYTKACEIAEKFEVKPRAVVQMAVRSDKVDYQKKERVSKSGQPVQRKPDMVEGIEKALAFDSGSLAGLEKASKSALEALLKSVSDTE